MTLTLPPGVAINAPILPGFETILTGPALELVAKLHRAFEPRRQELLAARAERAKRLDAGERPDFLAETKAIRESSGTAVMFESVAVVPVRMLGSGPPDSLGS